MASRESQEQRLPAGGTAGGICRTAGKTAFASPSPACPWPVSSLLGVTHFLRVTGKKWYKVKAESILYEAITTEAGRFGLFLLVFFFFYYFIFQRERLQVKKSLMIMAGKTISPSALIKLLTSTEVCCLL